MDVVWRLLDRPTVYKILSVLFLSAGITLACSLSSRFVREEVDTLVAQEPAYLVAASTPVFALPPATPLPTFTPTPTPTATPLPPPANRLSIPAIGLNTRIVETHPTKKTSWLGQKRLVWNPPARAVGHHDTSGNPGEGTNIVLVGHNNTQGEVFRRLPELRIDDEIILYTTNGAFHYRVQKRYKIPYLGAKAEGDATLQAYSAPTPDERVTLISCWPYATNAHRVVVIAVPASGGE